MEKLKSVFGMTIFMKQAQPYEGWDTSLIKTMRDLHVDVDLTYKIMSKLNAGAYDHVNSIVAVDIPGVDDRCVVELLHTKQYFFNYRSARERLDELGLRLSITDYGKVEDKHTFRATYQDLQRLGMEFAPIVGYGFLNGGSASSYTDLIINQKYGHVFEIYRSYFEQMAKYAQGNPKGITPAYLNPDGTPGEHYVSLKIRAILLKALRYMKRKNIKDGSMLYRLFQMDSVLNSEQIRTALLSYSQSPLLKDLIQQTHIDITHIYTASQPLLAAFTPLRPVSIFCNAYGHKEQILPMPGGHGQNFYVLKSIYQKLLSEGKRFVYLSNIDNMGSVVDDASLAYFVLSGKQAAFEFTLKTEVDVKGGIAVIDQNHRLNCGDIGIAIGKEEVHRAESSGKKLLFNAAIGLFDLKYLVSRLDEIIETLPIRLSIQEKAAGRYLQAEQITWEVIGMLDNPLFFVVNKYDRFLAAKTLIEALMGSSLKLDESEFPPYLSEIVEKLRQGLRQKLCSDYGMKLEHGKWVPL